MDDQFKDAVIDKTNNHEKRISELESNFASLPNMQEDLEQSRQILAEMSQMCSSLPVPLLQRLFESLDVNIKLHQQPQKIQHQHHFNWVAYIAAGLFLLLCLLSSGWYMTAKKLDEYVANDTKYRYLKLSNSGESNKMIHRVDSLFQSTDDLRKWVLNQEENRSRQAELAESIKTQQQKLKVLQRDTTLSKK